MFILKLRRCLVNLPNGSFCFMISAVRNFLHPGPLILLLLVLISFFFSNTFSTKDRAIASPNLEGVTGILNIPSAESAEDGEVFFGFGQNENRDRFAGNRQRNYFAGIGYLPGLEVCARYIEFPRIEEQVVPGFGTRKDRSVNIKYQFVCESCHKVSLAVGAYDVGGKARIESAAYFVGSKTLGPLKVSLGFGSKRLSGVFGGAEFKLSNKIALLYENDRVDNNFGLRLTPDNHLNLVIGRVNDDVGFGFSYVKDLVPPKGKQAPVAERIEPNPISEVTDQNALDKIARELAKLGYENIEVKAREDELAIKYENRLFRLEEEAWASMLLFASIYAPKDKSELRIVSRREGELILETRCKRDDILKYINGNIEVDELARAVKISDYEPPNYPYELETSLINSSKGTVDVFFAPANKLRLGEFFEPVKHRTGFAVNHDISLGKGLNLTGSVEFPLVNNLDNKDTLFLRNETLNLYKVSGNSRHFLLSGGYFGEHIYGAKSELRQFIQGNTYSYDIGIEGGVAKDKFFDLNEKELLLSATWRHPAYDLSVRGYTGRFFRGDEGWLVETKRYLGKHEIVLFAYNTDATSTEAGFRYTIPLLGYNDKSYSRSRFTIAPLFTYEYRTSSLPGADFLSPRVSVEDFRKRLYPFYLREHLDILRKIAHQSYNEKS